MPPLSFLVLKSINNVHHLDGQANFEIFYHVRLCPAQRSLLVCKLNTSMNVLIHHGQTIKYTQK